MPRDASRTALSRGPRRTPLPCGMNHDRLLTLPNAVSMSRLLLAAGFVATREPATRFALVAIASGTDFLDGWLARRRKSVTKWGALIDPIADRVFVLAAVCAFLVEGEISTATCLTLLSRDIATAIGFLVARAVPWLRVVSFRARWLGKAVTALQLLTLMAVVAAPPLVPALVIAVGATSVASIADYTMMLWRERAT